MANEDMPQPVTVGEQVSLLRKQAARLNADADAVDEHLRTTRANPGDTNHGSPGRTPALVESLQRQAREHTELADRLEASDNA